MIRRNLVTIALFLVAVTFILIGIVMKEPDDVLQKAIRICLECIGIG